MSNLATYRGTRFLGQAAAIAIVAGTVAGCSADVARFGGMFDETDNQAAIVNHPRQSPDMMATGSIRPLQPSRPASVVTGNTLPPAPGAARRRGRTVSGIGDTPQSLIYGPGRGAAGPGEPGFVAPAAQP